MNMPAAETVFLHDRLERTLLTVVTQLHTLHIERCSVEALRFVHDPVGRDKDELSLFVHELLDEPWTGDAIYFHFFTSYPLHS